MSTTLDLSRRPAPLPGPKTLAGLSIPALKAEMEGLGLDPKQAGMRAKQLRRWIHHFGTHDFSVMTDIAKDLRVLLAEKYTLERPEITDHQVSKDGTQKWLTRFAPGVEGESVYIPGVGKAGALCVSSQVGCTLNCTFCHTGTQALVRNLTAGEIVQQILITRDALGVSGYKNIRPAVVGLFRRGRVRSSPPHVRPLRSRPHSPMTPGSMSHSRWCGPTASRPRSSPRAP